MGLENELSGNGASGCAQCAHHYDCPFETHSDRIKNSSCLVYASLNEQHPGYQGKFGLVLVDLKVNGDLLN